VIHYIKDGPDVDVWLGWVMGVAIAMLAILIAVVVLRGRKNDDDY
jgi:hypothetical protein